MTSAIDTERAYTTRTMARDANNKQNTNVMPFLKNAKMSFSLIKCFDIYYNFFYFRNIKRLLPYNTVCKLST